LCRTGEGIAPHGHPRYEYLNEKKLINPISNPTPDLNPDPNPNPQWI